MTFAEDARGQIYVIGDDGMVRALDEVDQQWVRLEDAVKKEKPQVDLTDHPPHG